MGIRPGQAKGPYVGGAGSGGSTPVASPVTPSWVNAGTFTHEDFQAASPSNSIALYTLPIKGVIHAILLTPVAAFTGTGMGSYQITCGLAGNLDKYTAAYDVLATAPGNTVSQLTELLTQENHTTTTALLITATSDVNLNLSTAGSFTVDILVSVAPYTPAASLTVTPAWFNAGTFTHIDFQIAALSNSIALYTLPSKCVLHAILLTPVIAFAGTGMSSYQITCGLAGALDKYTAAFDVLVAAPGDTISQLTEMLAQENHAATTALLIAASSDANLDLSTAGSFTIDLLLSVTP